MGHIPPCFVAVATLLKSSPGLDDDSTSHQIKCRQNLVCRFFPVEKGNISVVVSVLLYTTGSQSPGNYISDQIAKSAF